VLGGRLVYVTRGGPNSNTVPSPVHDIAERQRLVVFRDEQEEKWLAVIGRALAFLSLHAAELRVKDIGEQAEFLQALGLSRDDIAPLIGSTAASIEVLLRKRKKKVRGGIRVAKKAAKRGK
jgi:hypothetical protein